MALVSLLVASGCGSDELVEAGEQNPPAVASTPATSTTEPEATESTATTVAPATVTTRPPAPPLLDGRPAPDVALDLDDETTLELLEAYEPVVVFFWATWCHNCHEMMPAIDQMSVDFAGRATVVAVARMSSLHDIENDVIDYLPSGRTRWASDEDNSISQAFAIPGNPVSILVVGGVETDRWLGSTDVADIRERLDSVLAAYR
jgi:thiol-disulfide isomerase/thioredoxin